MNPKSSSSSFSLLFLSFFLLSSATAINITRLLGHYPDFSTFSDFLNLTHLVSEINQRQTITILAVKNEGVSQLSGKTTEEIKNILSVHIVLDYYDVEKLKNLSKKTAILTTLFQSSGLAEGRQGFLNVTDLSDGEVAFGSAVKGSALGARLVKSVVVHPYNISVLQVSSVIMPGEIPISPPPPPLSAAPKKAPSPKSANMPAPTPSEEFPSEAPSEADAPVPSDADADSPVADAPGSSPPRPSHAEGPTADQAADASSENSSTRVALGMWLAISIGVVSSWVAP